MDILGGRQGSGLSQGWPGPGTGSDLAYSCTVLYGRIPSRVQLVQVTKSKQYKQTALGKACVLDAFDHAAACPRAGPPRGVLRASTALAWDRRWWALLSVAAQDAVAATLVEGATAPWPSPAGFDEPHLADVLGWQPPPVGASLLPLR